MSKGSKGKAKSKLMASEQKTVNYKLVLSSTCAVCKTPCSRGLRYLASMQEPGARGNGVPCMLTRTIG